MNKKYSILILLAAMTLPLRGTAKPEQKRPLLTNPEPSKHWKLDERFSDEFNTALIDEKKWDPDLMPWGERAWSKDNVTQTNGNLHISATHEPHKDYLGADYSYKLGILQSRAKTTYGFFEARIKGCSKFPGVCPAFWLYSHGKERNPDYPHVTYSEIDIVEMLQGEYDIVTCRRAGPDQIDCNLHTREIINGVETWRRPDSWPQVCRHHWKAPWDPRDDFHVYAVENTPEKITWYIDGTKVAEETNHNWHLPMSLALTMELRPPYITWTAAGRKAVPEASTPDGFPTHMEVDYVRCWTLAE